VQKNGNLYIYNNPYPNPTAFINIAKQGLNRCVKAFIRLKNTKKEQVPFGICSWYARRDSNPRPFGS